MLLLAVYVSAASATTGIKMTLSEVIDGSEVISIGTVLAIEETWDPQQELPFTHVTFSYLEVLKGEVDERELRLRFLGGAAPNGLTLVVVGMPEFRLGERFVLFSRTRNAGACPLVGWQQGLYRVRFDTERDAPIVTDYAGRHVVAIDGSAGALETRLSSELLGSPATGALTLDAFRNFIQREQVGR